MKAVINVNSRTYAIFIDQPLDLSIPLRAEKTNVNAWYQDEPFAAIMSSLNHDQTKPDEMWVGAATPASLALDRNE